MTPRAAAWAVLALFCSPVLTLGQEPRADGLEPVPPDENLPPRIARLSWFGERADSHVPELRHKLEHDPAEPADIKTVWKAGYRIER